MTAIVGGLLAAACFSAAILSSARASRMIGALPTLGGVMVVSLVVAIPVVLLTADGTLPPVEALPILAIAGVGNVVGLLFVYTALRSGKVGLVAALAATEGAVSALLAMLFGEVLAPLEMVGIAIVGVGVVFAALAPDPPRQVAIGSTRRAVLFGGLAGLSFGASLYATGRLGSELALGWAVLPPRIVGLVLIVIPLLATRRLRISRPAVPFVLVSGTAEIGGMLAFAWGARASIAVSSALSAQFASIAALVAWLALGERLSRLQWSGVAAVAIGVALLAFGSA